MADVFDVTIGPEAIRLWLSHYAHRVWRGSHRGVWHLYGHSHGSLADDPHALSMDVGVDVRGYGYWPLSFDEIREAMAQKDWRPVDHHGAESGETVLSAPQSLPIPIPSIAANVVSETIEETQE